MFCEMPWQRTARTVSSIASCVQKPFHGGKRSETCFSLSLFGRSRQNARFAACHTTPHSTKFSCASKNWRAADYPRCLRYYLFDIRLIMSACQNCCAAGTVEPVQSAAATHCRLPAGDPRSTGTPGGQLPNCPCMLHHAMRCARTAARRPRPAPSKGSKCMYLRMQNECWPLRPFRTPPSENYFSIGLCFVRTP